MEKNISAARSLLQLLPYMHEKFLNPMERDTPHRMSKLQLFAMMVLFRKGDKTMSELASIMQVSKQQLTPLVDRLFEQKLAERFSDSADRRVVRIEISQSGKTLIEDMMRQNLHTLAERLSVLPDEELVELDSIMLRIRELLEKAERLSNDDENRRG